MFGLSLCVEFFEVERRYNYTTPKTFLELIKLYKNVLLRKRKQTQDNIDRLENGLVSGWPCLSVFPMWKNKHTYDMLVLLCQVSQQHAITTAACS
jgi:hypothetical protein